MTTLASSAARELDASASAVFAYRLDFTNLPAYNPHVHQLELLQPERAGKDRDAGGGRGARYRFLLDSPGGAHRVTLTVTEVIQDRLVSATMQSLITARETFEVTPLPEDRCSVALRLWLELPTGSDPAQLDRLTANGAAEIQAELDAMADIFDRRGAST